MNAENGTEAMWIGFIGHCLQESTEAVHAFEDAVLALLTRYGAAVIIRGQRHEREPAELPAEIHILYFRLVTPTKPSSTIPTG